ncbi:ribonuclease J [Candidatus Parcubacteria bacterium]|nr:MAG: ribonuclease J [Candidatus Parcubacteria bacterium]
MSIPNDSHGAGPRAPRRPMGPRTGGRGPRPGGPRRRPFGGQARAPRRPQKLRLEHPTSMQRGKGEVIAPPTADTVRIIPLGGVEEIGRNMVAVETERDIFIIDAGFQFSEAETPGIDYILPNTGYLEERKNKIRGILVTHGHLDHVGGIPYIIERIGNPMIYTRRLTAEIIKKRQEEFASAQPVIIREVEEDEWVTLGSTKVGFFNVTHTVPDSMGVIIETPFGDVVHTGDIKLDHDNGVPTQEEVEEFSVFHDRKVLMLMMDSTNVERPGFSISERIVLDTLEELIANTPGRIILGTFASQLERLIHIVRVSEAVGRKIVVDGRSMKTNLEIARQLGLLKFKDGSIIQTEHMGEYPPEKIIVLATGAQGDEFASLMRIANKTHKYITLTPKDTIILSSSVIPGNERAVQKMKDNLSRQGSHIITYQTSDVHASGHGNREEALWIHRQVKPKFFMPVHGYHYMLRVHCDIAVEAGVARENAVIPDNSAIFDILNGEKIMRLPMKAPHELRVVEGHSVTELSDVLMRDRKALGEEGFCVVVATVDRRTGKLHKSPDIISRGFVYLRDNKDLMDQTRLIIRKSVETSMRNPRAADLDNARDDLAESVSRFLLQRTLKRPIVIPVIVSV